MVDHIVITLKIKKNLDAVSKKIFGYVKSFQWTLTADGRDYQTKVGCLNCDSIPNKRYKLYVENLEKTKKQVDNMVSTLGAKDAQIKTTESAKTLNLLCNPQEHNNHGGRRITPYPLTISK